MKQQMECPLCRESSPLFKKIANRVYYRCPVCGALFMDKDNHPSPVAEKNRYLEHNNDVNDPSYQEFVRPLVDSVRNFFGPAHKGLDFGAGTGPVASKLLRDISYDIELYDPFFWRSPEKLEKKYDYIICCEVMEHFAEPGREFALLRSLLNAGGSLFCKTSLYGQEIDFEKWYYKDDPTHLIFYSRETLEWIRQQYSFASLAISKGVISFALSEVSS